MRSHSILRSCLLSATALTTPVALVAPHSASAQTATPAPAPAPTPAPAATAEERKVRALSGTVQPKWGNIRTFWGDNSPLWGNIRTFWGDVSPYEGDLQGFWGNIRTFNDGTTQNAVSPLWGNIRTFNGDLGASWGNIRTFWGNIRTFQDAPGDYATLATQLNDMVAKSQSFWGDAVQAQTGKSFSEAFANPLLAKYGINLSDPSSLAKLDADTREHFFLDWYDGLMNFSGADHVDHWMNEIHWSPAITKTIGEGKRSIIGLLDFSVTGGETQNITKYDGISSFTTGHGSAVASLMIAAHDGKGVMGIAPMASVVAYNPFDSTGTAGWTDIKNGIVMLTQNNASIINMSLGVPGWTLNAGWNTVFSDPTVSALTKGSVFVLAAGNDGISQTQSFKWNFPTDPAMLIVGSVDPNGNISSFSNRPGNACLLNPDGKCDPKNMLMNRFIVAPGELILVSDGNGGVTRMSGTSFAAPLVSGTIALIHDRWPWLADKPKETVQIIVKSARDLGAPGPDPVYGVGMLDVTAALSPLDFGQLKWYQYDASGKLVTTSASKIRDPKQQALWETAGMFFYAYEDVGSTFRDFAIPVSSKLVDGTAMSKYTGSMEGLQAYIYSRYLVWVQSGGKNTSGSGFSLAGAFTAPVHGVSGMDVSMAIAPRTLRAGFRESGVPYQTAVRIAGLDGRFSLTAGQGDGAVLLGGNMHATASDYDPVTGGLNPLLGFASGGAFLESSVKLDDHWTLSSGMTQRVLERDLRQLNVLDQFAYGGIDPYQSGAYHLSLSYAAGPVSVTGTYTKLSEKNALFGIQSADPHDFADGTNTDGMTLGANVNITDSLHLNATGTMSRTRPGGSQNLAISDGGLISSSFQVGVSKSKLFGSRDQARITLSQPMHLERGAIDMTTVQVVNRQTGELGSVTQRFNLGIPERQLVGEMVYGVSMLNDAAQLSVFGRANLHGIESDQLPAVMAGAGFRLNF